MKMYDIWLRQVSGMDSGILMKLREAQNGNSDFAKNIYEMKEEDRRKLFHTCLGSVMGEDGVKRLSDAVEKAKASVDVQDCAKRMTGRGIKFIAYDDSDYPEKFRNLFDPPSGLYVQGEMPATDRPVVAVVGTKYPSSYGCNQARWFSDVLSRSGIQIITGMAEGVETIAGHAALNAGKKSYAFMGCGTDVCYPAKNIELYLRLLGQGGVLSEYPPGTKQNTKYLVARNRLIGGIADVILVIEAKVEYAQMIAVDVALQQGTDVFAVPGRNNDQGSKGCNYLLRQGAGVATSPYDLLEYFYGSRDKKEPGPEVIPLDKQYDLDVFANLHVGEKTSNHP